jgi:uncharacterized SAM-binding protein YcdF (DUF218 family)
LVRILCLFVLLELIAVATGMAIAVQASRSDAPAADAALVMLNGSAGDQLRLDRAQQLLVEGNVSRVVLAGRDVEPSSAYLEQQGMQPTALIKAQAHNQIVQIADAQRALAEARLANVLVLAEPSQMLRMLKIARDAGLQPRSFPLGVNNQVPVSELALEVGRVFRYVLAGQ